jgi:hypothetical protein
VPAGLDVEALGSEGEMDVGMGAEEFGGDTKKRGLGGGDFEVVEEDGGDELVDENAAMLRVVAEFNDVPMAVVCLQQMRLGSPSHFADMPDGRERHQKENAVI